VSPISSADTNGRIAASSRLLGAIEAAADDDLGQLRRPDSDHSLMLSTLVVTNCLLEVTRLASQRMTLSEFTAATVSCVLQFAPTERCALVVRTKGLPAAVSVSGVWSEEDTAMVMAGPVREGLEWFAASTSGRSSSDEVLLSTIELDGECVGFLAVGQLPQHLVDAQFVDRVSAQIATVLGALVEAEQLRRRAALNELHESLAGIDESFGEADVERIVTLMQSVPGATGCHAHLELRRFGGPIALQSGDCSELRPATTSTAEIDRCGTVHLSISWNDEHAAEIGNGETILARVLATLQRAEHTARLIEESETDELTGVGNRRRGSRALAQSLQRSARTGESIAILLIDLDWFKQVNDEHGHAEGDRVLRIVAEVIDETIRAYDVAARWGGEEFLVMCPATDLVGATALAHRLLDATPQACSHRTAVREQTISIGIAVAPQHGENPTELLRRADEALYGAKRSGRNRAVAATAKSIGTVSR
jgi:diguanylate cyclase (GGDEF)-like protein